MALKAVDLDAHSSFCVCIFVFFQLHVLCYIILIEKPGKVGGKLDSSMTCSLSFCCLFVDFPPYFFPNPLFFPYFFKLVFWAI